MPNAYEQRKRRHHFEKVCIGAYTAHYLRHHAPGLPIAVDGGSTNLAVIKAICQDVRKGHPTVSMVLTNHVEGLMEAHGLPDDREPFWIGTGGQFRPSRCVFAEEAETTIAGHDFWVAVVGSNGFVPPWIQTNTEREHLVKKTMIQQALTKVVFPIDSSKWGVPAGRRLHMLDEIAAKGKDIALLTCYPVQQDGETDTHLGERVHRFLTTADSLIKGWDFDATIFAALATPKGIDKLTKISLNVPSLPNELKRFYTEMVPPDQQQVTGLALEFELRRSLHLYSCFISHSSQDQPFAKQIYLDLQQRGAQCWFAPEDMKIGDPIRSSIDQSIRRHDKLLLVLSKDSVASNWVEQEVETALESERKLNRTVLFPIRLDDAVMEVEDGWPALIRQTRHIGDFTQWQDSGAYQIAFERLLKDLKAQES